MTQKKAKEISLEIWQYLADNPEIRDKKDLPKKLYNKIRFMPNKCPLCKEFLNDRWDFCPGCPLRSCISTRSLYFKWKKGFVKEHWEAAKKIVEILQAWEPEE